MYLPTREARSGVSPVPAELVLIALVVGAGVIVYIFVSGLAGNLTKSPTQSVTQQLSLDAYAYPTTGPLTFTIRNVGNTSVSIQVVYFDGSPVSPGCTGPLAPKTTVQCSFTPSPVPAQGSTHQVKVVTAAGGSFQFNVVAGIAS